MGQYYKVVNLDKKEYINPHDLGDGLKFLEFAPSGWGTMFALGYLLQSTEDRFAGGDISAGGQFRERWAGDQIVIAGDYDDPKKYPSETRGKNLYDSSEGRRWKNVSMDVVREMIKDDYVKEMFQDKMKEGGWFGSDEEIEEILGEKDPRKVGLPRRRRKRNPMSDAKRVPEYGTGSRAADLALHAGAKKLAKFAMDQHIPSVEKLYERHAGDMDILLNQISGQVGVEVATPKVAEKMWNEIAMMMNRMKRMRGMVGPSDPMRGPQHRYRRRS